MTEKVMKLDEDKEVIIAGKKRKGLSKEEIEQIEKKRRVEQLKEEIDSTELYKRLVRRKDIRYVVYYQNEPYFVIKRVPAHITEKYVASVHIAKLIMEGKDVDKEKEQKIYDSWFELLSESIVAPEQAKDITFLKELDGPILRALTEAVVLVNMFDVDDKKLANF